MRLTHRYQEIDDGVAEGVVAIAYDHMSSACNLVEPSVRYKLQKSPDPVCCNEFAP